MRATRIPGAPRFVSGHAVQSGMKRRHGWRTTDGRKHEVTIRKVQPA